MQYKEICKSMAKSGESGTRYFSENMIDLQNQLKRQMKNSEFINWKFCLKMTLQIDRS